MKAILAPVAVVASLVTACSGGSSAGSGSGSVPSPSSTAANSAHEITIDATDQFRFMPATATVSTGTVTIHLHDTGTYPHNISFPSLHKTSKSVGDGITAAKDTTFTVTFNKPGSYRFICTYHSDAGMVGVLNVQ